MHRLGSDELIPEGMEHYLHPEDHNKIIYYCKNEDVSIRLNTIIQDPYPLKGYCLPMSGMIFLNTSFSSVYLKNRPPKTKTIISFQSKNRISPLPVSRTLLIQMQHTEIKLARTIKDMLQISLKPLEMMA